MARAWFGFWIWALYALRLRRPLNNLQRWIAGERKAPRAELARLLHPADLVEHFRGYDWRPDGTRIGGIFLPLDYVSAPEVTEARLRDASRADGDCDDAHHLAAVYLERMIGVERAYHVTIGYRGGGHLACVYRFRGAWYLLNYDRIHLLDRLDDVEAVLLRWATRAKGIDVGPARWLVFETTDFQRVRP